MCLWSSQWRIVKEPHASLCFRPSLRWFLVGANRLWVTKPIWYTCPNTSNLYDPPSVWDEVETEPVTKGRHASARDCQWNDFGALESGSQQGRQGNIGILTSLYFLFFFFIFFFLYFLIRLICQNKNRFEFL